MRRASIVLLSVLIFAFSPWAFGDTISGTGTLQNGNSQITLTTPQGFTISGSYLSGAGTFTIDVLTGSFTASVIMDSGPEDLCMSPASWMYCRNASLLGSISGTLTSLPVYMGSGIWSIPSQTFVLNGTANIYYHYLTQDLTNYGGTFMGFPVLYQISTGGDGVTQGGVSNAFRIDATFPSPIPEPATLALVASGVLGAIPSRRRMLRR